MAGEDSTLINAGSELARGQTRCAEKRSHNSDLARPTDSEVLMNDPSPLEVIFFAALEKSLPQERAAYLDEACAGDPDLRRRIEKMLAAQDQDGSFLEKPAKSAAMTADYQVAERPGSVIGPYKLLEQIGEGGFGVVFVAEQTQPVRRRVALKILKPGMDTRPIVARFEAERQALAIMDHPNIAKVHDGGATLSGRPYFVMELVKGVPITEFCDQNQLTPRQRLELFVPVCQAVQHAHQKGIIHRDLKPSNVLVSRHDTTPVVKVIDFGVAKALGQELTDKTLYTGIAQMIGTPLYMSPEQAGMSDLDIDTRSDIYSLGVLLYELLTGTTPFTRERFQQATYEEIRRIIREEDPPRPSTRLSDSTESLPSISALRQTEPAKLTRLVRGELDWIVMKAMEKDRNRRYETASGFARDLQRYLHDEPVEARPASAGYRLRKFLKRHKAPAIAAGLVLMALLIGVAGTTFGLIRAEVQRKNAERARKAETKERERAESQRDKAVAAEAKTRTINEFLTQDLLTQAEPANNAVEDHVQLLVVLDRAAANVGQRFAGQPELESTLRATIARIYHGLASWEKAEAQWRSLLERAQKRDPKSSDSYSALAELAHILRHRGRGDAEAMKMAETAAEGLERALGPDHGDTRNALALLALAYHEAGKLTEAIALLERVRDAEIAELGPDHPSTLNLLNHLAGEYVAAGRLPEAIALFERVRDARTAQLGPEHPDTLITLDHLGLAYRDAGNVAGAIALFERVRDARTAQFGPEHLDTLTTLDHLALAYRDAGKLPEAIALFERVRDACIAQLGPDHPETLTVLNNLALAYQAAGKLPEAITLFERVRDAEIAQLGPGHRSTLTVLGNLAGAYQAAGRVTEAIALFERVRDAQMARFGPDHPDTLTTLDNLAFAYQAAGRVTEAIALFERVRDGRIARLGPDHPDTLTTLSNLAWAYWSVKRLDKSVPLFEDVVKRKEAKLGRQHTGTQTTIGNLGVNYMGTGRLDEAIPLLEEVHRASIERPTLRWVIIPLLDAYVKAGRRAEAGELARKLAADARSALPKGSPQLADALVRSGSTLLDLKAYADAELVLRECLAIREKTQPDLWTTFTARSMLGGALLGEKKYAEAEPLLVAGYEGMKRREATIAPEAKDRLIDALERLVQFYEATARPDEAARWRKERESHKAAEKPAGKKP